MNLLNTPYTASTGVAIACVTPKVWRHIDTNDGGVRPVGGTYTSRKEIMGDHVSYLLKSGWLRLTIPLPTPVLKVSVHFGAYAWRMEDMQVGILIFGNSKVEAIALFKKAVADEYEGRVTIDDMPHSKPRSQQETGNLLADVCC